MTRNVRRNKQAGQALVLTAAALVALTGFAGLAIDVGVLRYQRRLQQTAADAGAVAGAQNLAYANGVTAAAQSASATNGFADTAGGQISSCTNTAAVGTVCVQVNNPPLSGPHASGPNAAKYVEVLVSEVHSTYFMKILGFNSSVVMARAVATNLSGGASAGCLYTLGKPSASIEGVNINGHATLNAPNCGIVDNGNFNTQGNSLTVTASTFGTSGSWVSSGPGGSVTCTGQTGACPTPNMPSSGDPFANLTPPCSPCVGGSAVSINGNGNFTGAGVTYNNGVYTVAPGTYSSISISGTGSGNTVVFSPGTYVFDGSGGLTIPGNATISGNGVTFYFTNTATIGMTGNPSIQLTAPSSGTYAGILMYQDPLDTNVGPAPNGPTLGGNSASFYNGVLYFPKDQLTFYGNNTSFAVAVVVADSLALSGNPTVNLEGTAGLPPGVSLLSVATLVE